MIVLTDSDIVFKLAGCDLLNTFFEVINIPSKDILITSNAKSAIPKQAKKKICDESVCDDINNFVANVSVTPVVDYNLLAQLQSFEGMDGGESYLMLVA
mgnify:FL=1